MLLMLTLWVVMLAVISMLIPLSWKVWSVRLCVFRFRLLRIDVMVKFCLARLLETPRVPCPAWAKITVRLWLLVRSMCVSNLIPLTGRVC